MNTPNPSKKPVRVSNSQSPVDTLQELSKHLSKDDKLAAKQQGLLNILKRQQPG